MPSSFHIENFGCRAARADGEAIGAILRSSGAAESPLAQADVVVVNTCSVTAEADREARAWIRRAHRLNPEARIVATGCYAQRAPEELATLHGVAAVIGNSHKALAPEVVLSLMNGSIFSSTNENLVQIQTGSAAPKVLADDSFAHSFLEEAPITPGAQTRPNLKIQEGCSNRCSFCVIPQTRGNSRSLPAPSVLNQIRSFVAAGGNEIVLSGINLGRWGRDLRTSQFIPQTLAALIRAIFEQTSLPRVRLSSIEPMDWDKDLINLMSEYGGSRLTRHAHLPLQSGSDSVLRRMHRRYRPWHYAEKVAELLSAAGPDLTFGADVMAGFPGETDREFRDSCDFIQSLPFGYLHLFPFSPRPGTRAWALHAENPVPARVVNERMSALRSLADQKTRAHRNRFIGAELDAITLHTPPSRAAVGRTTTLTENFLPVELVGRFAANQLARIRITSAADENAVLAELAAGDQSRSPEPHPIPELNPEPLLENVL